MIHWIIVDKDNPCIETAWRSEGRLLLVETKELATRNLELFFSRTRQEQKTIIPVQVEIVSETALVNCKEA